MIQVAHVEASEAPAQRPTTRPGTPLATSLAAAAAYLVLAFIFTWPLLPHWHDLLVGDQELPAFMWRAWWMERILTDGWSLTSDFWDRLAIVFLSAHYPEAGNLNDMALALPLQHWLGFPAYHNVKAVAIILFNAMAGYWLAAELTRSRAAGFVGGAALAFNPYTAEMINIGRLRESILGFEALAALFLYRTLAQPPTAPNAIAAGLFSALTAAFYWFYGHYLILWTVILVLANLRNLTLKRLPYLALTAWVAAIVILPFGAPYVSQAMSGRLGDDMASPSGLPTLEQLSQWHDPHDRDALVLNSLRRLLQEARHPEYLLDFDRPDSLALAVVLLAVVGAVAAARTAAPWAIAAVLFYLTSLGPYWRWDSQYASPAVELPHAFFFRHLPFFSRLYAPNRAESMLLVCLAVLAALGLAALFTRASARVPEKAAAVALVLVGIFVPMWVVKQLPLRFIPAAVPEGYRLIKDRPGEGAVLELPAEASRDELNFYQTLHQRPLAGGWATNPPTPLTLQSMRIGSSYHRAAMAARELERGITRDRIAELEAQGIRYIVVHERFFIQQDANRGSERYHEVAKDLQEILGPPIAVNREQAPEANAFLPPGWGHRPTPVDYEVAFFAVAP